MKRIKILLRVICALSSLITMIPSNVGYADDGSVRMEELCACQASALGLTEAEASKLDPLLKLLIQNREIAAQIPSPSPEEVPRLDSKGQISTSFLETMSRTISVREGTTEPTVDVLINTTDNARGLSALGVDIQAKVGDICTANVPITRLAEIARLNSVIYIEASRIMEATNDVSVPETGATQARADYGVSGEGVIVGYIDTGIDFTHEDFRNPDGSTRVKYLLDLSDPGDLDSDGDLDGPDDFGGTLYTEADINAALAENGRVFPSTDTPIDIPDEESISSHIDIDEDLTINAFAVDIEIWHSNIGDLRVYLKSPAGTYAWLHDRTGGDANDIIGTFLISDFNGESTEGTWTLKVADLSEDYSGDLMSWGIRINQVVRQEDNVGHGSHGTGTAAGNGGVAGGEGEGSAVAVGTYAGMAPESDLIVVKATRTDVGAFYTSDVVNVLSFIDQKAGELGKPFVANLSLGGHVGPHDGTSLHEQAIDNLVGPDIPGKAVVVSAGNEGDEDIHDSGTVRQDRKTTVSFDVPSSTYMALVDVWYPGSDEFGVGFEDPDGVGKDKTNLRPGQSGCWVYYAVIWGIRLDLYAACVYHEHNSQLNGDKEIQLLLLGLLISIDSGEWKLYLHGDEVESDGRFDAWVLGAEFTDPDPSMRVGMPGTARNAMTVGAYMTKDEWVDVDGISRECEDYPEYIGCCPEIGDSACFSSDGPTRDGRQKPEITAPGQMIASTYSGHAPAGSRFSMFPSDEWIVQDERHGVSLGTSFSAPHVAGAVALIMEVDPSLDAIQIRDLISNTARSDTFTEPVPNYRWGYGKLDVLAAIREIIPLTVIAMSPNYTCLNTTPTDVTITGDGFEPTPTVTIDTTPPTSLTNVTYADSTTLTATVPEGIAPGTYDITVTNPGPSNFSDTLTDGFTVMKAPTVIAMSPNYTCLNTTPTDVTITGDGFEPTPTVTIDTTPPTSLTNVTYADSTTLTATVPEGIAPGTYDITVTNPGPCNLSGTLIEGFAAIEPPTVITISPDTGLNITTTDVTITGTNFEPTPTVTIDTTPLINVTYVNSTTITATVPEGIPPGTYDVTVTNSGPCNLPGTLPDGFTVMERLYVYLPVIVKKHP